VYKIPERDPLTYSSILQRDVNGFRPFILHPSTAQQVPWNPTWVGPKPSWTKGKRRALCLRKRRQNRGNGAKQSIERNGGREGDRQDLEEFTRCSASSFPSKSQFPIFPLSHFLVSHMKKITWVWICLAGRGAQSVIYFGCNWSTPLFLMEVIGWIWSIYLFVHGRRNYERNRDGRGD
jgi:hypothetical protein